MNWHYDDEWPSYYAEGQAEIQRLETADSRCAIAIAGIRSWLRACGNHDPQGQEHRLTSRAVAAAVLDNETTVEDAAASLGMGTKMLPSNRYGS